MSGKRARQLRKAATVEKAGAIKMAPRPFYRVLKRLWRDGNIKR